MNPQNFCRNMKYFRELSKLSFTELSAQLSYHGIEISAPTLQRYESGKIKNVPYETIVALAEIFSTTPTALIGWDGSNLKHRTTNLDQRFADFIQELATKTDTYTIDGLELDKDDVKLLREMLRHDYATLSVVVKAKRGK